MRLWIKFLKKAKTNRLYIITYSEKTKICPKSERQLADKKRQTFVKNEGKVVVLHCVDNMMVNGVYRCVLVEVWKMLMQTAVSGFQAQYGSLAKIQSSQDVYFSQKAVGD